MNNQLTTTLQELGINQKESEVYLELLKLGQEGATRLSSATGINRVTIYGILEALKQKGFVTTMKKDKKTNFIAIEPKKILNLLKQKEMNFSAVVSELESLANTSKNKSSVKIYESDKAVYELMMEIFGSGKQVYSFGNMDIPELQHEFGTSNLRKLRLMAGTRIQGISNKLPSEHTEKQRWKKNTEIRILKSLSKLTTWTYVWEGKVANISYKNGLIGELIEDEEFANTQKFLWDMMWGKAKKV
jgi:sugar-specific transcriptional regulator TrmB